ncbi:ABC transporter substrate-binding protein [Sphingomicrobium flavum]|uniref:ABC transporter substrate-binding protein n=1 Tax=Sphingomicrobium flavum TaxID=1229164 RepID=UPI0021ADC999|nr:ABC transporter substrate-binding protein [Sphingomicrobium flavum]
MTLWRPLPLIIALAALSGCGDDNPGETRIAIIDEEPQLVDPARTAPDAGDEYLLASLAQGLVRFDARGQVEAGLAERWHVSDDGRSYIFRLAPQEWPDGEPVTAREVARALKRQMTARANPLSDAFGSVEDVVAMTDRVIEIRLTRARPDLLFLLAQPQMALLHDGTGSGPFLLSEAEDEDGLHLSRIVETDRTAELEEEMLHVSPATAQRAVGMFSAGEVEMVLGGSFADLPFAQAADLDRGRLLFDPVIGLFGLKPQRRTDALDDAEVRAILSRAIDRDAFLADLSVPGLLPRARILQAGLDVTRGFDAPGWIDEPIKQRQTRYRARLEAILGAPDEDGAPLLGVLVHLPDGPGGDMLFNRLATDWARIGVEARRAEQPGDAHYVLIDEVAPSGSSAWFVRHFRCTVSTYCLEEADTLMATAREATNVADRETQLVGAALMLDDANIFIPIAAPVRWSLVGPYVTGFAPTRLGRHPLTGLKGPLPQENAQ